MSVRIRRAVESDLDAIIGLNAQVHAIHVAARPDYFRAVEPRAVAKWLGGMLDDPSIVVWLAERASEVVGYVLVMTKERAANPFCHARLTAEIDQIAVDAGSRETGVGRALIEHAIDHAATSGIETVELNVWAFNEAARCAFEAVGFAPRVLTLERIKT